MSENMLISEKEQKLILEYQEAINKFLKNLGGVRKQFLIQEGIIIKKLESAENDYFSYLKTLAKSRGMKENENWIYDPTQNKFVKKE